MKSQRSFSCYLIGADTLLMECGAALLERGHRVLGVISDTPRIAQWARDNGLSSIPAASDYTAELARHPYDHLFSITHLQIIPKTALSTPSGLAINFHDGPLPRYAGLNAPAWALIHREPRYGISWHVMTGGADEGDVLEQVEFDVAPEETSLSINTRCFAAAIESFGTLIDRLARGDSTGRAQDLSARTYFGRHDKPAAAGCLCWDQSAAQLEALVRGLDFGPYENPLSVARILGPNGAVNLTAASVEDEEPRAEHAAGTVLAIDRERIRVQTADGILSITGFTTPTGEVLTPESAADRLGVAVGDHMPQPDGPLAERLVDAVSRASRSEGFWRGRLETFEPVEIPSLSPRPRQVGAIGQRALEIPAAFSARHTDLHALLAGVCAWLGRIGAKDRYSLPVRDLIACAPGTEPIFSPHAIVQVALDREAPFDVLVASLDSELERLRGRDSWLLDLIARQPSLQARPRLRAGELSDVEVALVEGPLEGLAPSGGAALTIALAKDGGRAGLVFDTTRLSEPEADAIAARLEQLLDALARSEPGAALGRADWLGDQLRERVLVEWNDTATTHDETITLHALFAQRVAATPEHTAVTFEGRSLSYRELDRLSNGLAHHLTRSGVGRDDLVGIYVERSLDLPVAVLASLKAGAAYVPLDPAYPRDRIALMIEDSGLRTILTTTDQVHTLPVVAGVEVIRMDRDRQEADAPPAHAGRGEDLCYVIYTSGSTGRPKGVMVEHRNVVNFMLGMDSVIAPEPAGVWFAVTSLSFDISVLELLWTLTRGFEVVVHLDRERLASQTGARPATSARHIDFGLFYWGNDDGPGRQKYRLLMDGARFADQNGFVAVWTPERHFHAFGGPYPNSAVTGAAVAATTQNLEIRSGSCVIPLHNPIRVAEEWAVIDNLSNGRVALGIASGWQPDDFVLAPGNFKDNKTVTLDYIDKLRRLWRGEKIAFRGPLGDEVEVGTQPRPVQAEVPIWLTTAGNPDTYRNAARAGANVLTHLLGQSVEEVGEKVVIYREALREAGHDPDDFKVTLMLHTFVGDDTDAVRELVRAPMKAYLSSSVSLVKNFAWAFPAFKRPEGLEVTANDVDLSVLSEEELDAILDFAFERYFETSGLFGDVDRCVAMIERCKAIGVDEIACLIDYGVATDAMLDSLPRLKTVLERSQAISAETRRQQAVAGDHSIAEQFRRHGVTHMQCTPSMARMLLADDASRAALGRLSHMLVGGEAFPPALARDLREVLTGRLTNMYGPTETTIWSTSHEVPGDGQAVPIGRPIANTRLYVLDDAQEPVPPGVPGELYIAGDGVVRGYLERPELTAERFVAEPFSERPGDRMYRTGDLVRYRDDGVLEYIGRTDHQVKVRGYRIELGEIEARMAGFPGIRECVVVVREDAPGDPRIVGYFASDGAEVDPGALRERLRESLPEYMVPGHLIALPALPLTPNGKIDRKALPAPDAVSGASRLPYVAPESEFEQTLVQLWQEVLGRDRVGTEDNFFDVGGHSLLVVKLHRELKKRIDQPVALTDLYRFPTIRSLTARLSASGSSETLQASSDRAQRRREALARRRGRGPRR